MQQALISSKMKSIYNWKNKSNFKYVFSKIFLCFSKWYISLQLSCFEIFNIQKNNNFRLTDDFIDNIFSLKNIIKIFF